MAAGRDVHDHDAWLDEHVVAYIIDGDDLNVIARKLHDLNDLGADDLDWHDDVYSGDDDDGGGQEGVRV